MMKCTRCLTLISLAISPRWFYSPHFIIYSFISKLV